MMSDTKTCRRCEQAKTQADFYRNSQMSDGFANICKMCTLWISKLRYRARNIPNRTMRFRNAWRAMMLDYIKEKTSVN